MGLLFGLLIGAVGGAYFTVKNVELVSGWFKKITG